MRTLGTIYDPVFEKKQKHSFIHRFFLNFINDERDLPFASLTLAITLAILPLAVVLYIPGIPGWVWWTAALLYLYLNNLYFKGPFGLMLHCTSHRIFFKKQYNWMNYYLPWILAPFFGHSPETYFVHHIGMHHVENNMEEDRSSTMKYQRDSFLSFLSYFWRFLSRGAIDVYQYLSHKKRNTLKRRLAVGEGGFFIFVIVLSFINFPATLVAFIIPFFIFRFLTMMGNWTQHSFIDPEEPDNFYKSSINCINIRYNKRCWNDGYHTSHHVRPNLHWTQHPENFRSNTGEYARNKAIIFEGLDFLQIFYYLMNKRYQKLASHVINIDGTFASEAEIMETLQRRAQAIAPAPGAE